MTSLVGSIVLGIVAWVVLDGDSEKALAWLAIALILHVGGLGGRRVTRSGPTTNFVITSDRIIFRSGVVAKSGIEIPLERVNNVLFNQSDLRADARGR